MAIPDYQSCMRPLLKAINDGQSHILSDIVSVLADHFNLTEEERSRTFADGKSLVLANRVSWARTYLKQAGLIESVSRGVFQLTEEGRRVVNSGVEPINKEFLKKYPSFQAFISKSGTKEGRGVNPDDLEDLLGQFGEIADKWFRERSFVVDYNKFIRDFFQPDNLKTIQWPDIQELGNHLHSFQANALARARAFGNPNYDIQQYRDSFLKLAHGEDDLEERMRWFLTDDAAANKYLGASSVSELVGQLNSETHVFFNGRDETAAKFLGVELEFQRGDDAARRFIKFNEAIRSVVEAYERVVGLRTAAGVGVEVDQFFSWLCENKIKDVSISPKTPSLTEGRRIWEFAPGRKAVYWDEFLEKGIAAMGWDRLGDLRQFKSREELTETLKDAYNSENTPWNDSLALWQWTNEVKPGDIILAKKGRREIVGMGVVTGEYEYYPEREKYKHVHKTDWREKGPWQLPEGFNLNVKTLTDITPYEDRVNKVMSLIDTRYPPIETKNYWWINSNPSNWDLAKKPVGHVETYTAYDDDGSKRRIFKYFETVKPGDEIIGYVTSPVRRVTSRLVVKSLLAEDQGFKVEVKEHFPNSISWENLQKADSLADCEPLKNIQGSLFSLSEEEFMAIIELGAGPIDNGKPEVFTKEDALAELYMDEPDFQKILDRLEAKRNVILQGPPGVGKTFAAKRIAYTLLGETDASRIRMIQFHQSYSYEDFVRGFRPSNTGGFILRDGVFFDFCSKARNDDRPYVFIIDEINRGIFQRFSVN